MKSTPLQTTINSLFSHGLGEYPVLCQRIDNIYLGNMIFDKGHIFFKDRGIMTKADAIPDDYNWLDQILGMVCFRDTYKWQSLTFYGVDHCQLDGIESAQRKKLTAITDPDRNRMSDFIGSVYRAFHTLMEHDFLPIGLLHPVNTYNNEHGICVCDIQSAGLSAATTETVRKLIHNAVDRQLTIKLEDITVPRAG